MATLPAVIEAEWTEQGSALPVPAQADSDRDLIAMWIARSAGRRAASGLQRRQSEIVLRRPSS